MLCSNPSRPELQGLEVSALADGHRRTVPYMEIWCCGSSCTQSP